MDTQGKVTVFLSEYDMQLNEINKIYDRLEKKSVNCQESAPGEELVESTGYWLHNLYSAFEDLFKLVSSFWENNITGNGNYHVNLLKRMRVEIPGVRPAVISETSHKHLDELRGFRHVFRHAYNFGLDEERILFLLNRVLKTKRQIMADLTQFRKKF
ncbi:MAG: hypothetical protein ACQES8_04055 [Thermodesulfobacteriota bacterium]